MDKHDETFARWFCRECPPGTVISSPEWWAAKIEFRLRTEWGKEQGLTRHEFYKDGDKDVPEQIKDRNGQVVLTLCKLCNQAEGELESDYCPQPTESRAEWEREQLTWKEAVLNELIVCHIYNSSHDNDPRKAVHDAITCNCQIALDPTVSSEAQALIDRGAVESRAAIAAREGE